MNQAGLRYETPPPLGPLGIKSMNEYIRYETHPLLVLLVLLAGFSVVCSRNRRHGASHVTQQPCAGRCGLWASQSKQQVCTWEFIHLLVLDSTRAGAIGGIIIICYYMLWL